MTAPPGTTNNKDHDAAVSANKVNTNQQQQRMYSLHTPQWQRFQTDLLLKTTAASNKQGAPATNNPYQRQYAHVYHQRLTMLGKKLQHQIQKDIDADVDATKNNKIQLVPRILELQENVPSAVVGTVVVERNNDDKETTGSGDNGKKKKHQVCCYYLEDESGRVAVRFPDNENNNNNNNSICCATTGVVLGLVGIVDHDDGVLCVTKIYTPNTVVVEEEIIVPNATTKADDNNNNNAQPHHHVLLLSGLDCGSPEYTSLSRDILVSYLQGMFGTKQPSQISHVLVAGGLVFSPQQQKQQQSTSSVTTTTTTDGCRELDGFCWQLATQAGLPVTVLPGQYDPTTANWPQRPLHPSLLPRAAPKRSFVSRSPNPYLGKLQDTRILATDGTNISDLVRQIGNNSGDNTMISEIDALQKCLEWSHVCPTGPDSVPTIPHAETDPMVLDNVPQLLVAGNCQNFATRCVRVNNNNGGSSDDDDDDDGSTTSTSTCCRLVCVPKFAETGVGVLVNLETLAVHVLRFDAITEE